MKLSALPTDPKIVVLATRAQPGHVKVLHLSIRPNLRGTASPDCEYVQVRLKSKCLPEGVGTPLGNHCTSSLSCKHYDPNPGL